MAARIPTLEKPPAPPRGPDGPAGDRGPGRGGEDAVAPATPAKVFVWLFVGTVIVLFAAFTSTYLARRGQPGWTEVPLPPVLWLSTVILAVSSGVLEWARRQGRAGRLDGLRRGLVLTTVLGIGFLASQLVAWRQLVSAGLYLSTDPHSSFFYLLTGAHGLHLLGGLGALLYTGWKVHQIRQSAPAVAFTDPTATYWHFLGILWVYLFGLLFWL
jgi:cytochrome c oxidase subunit 3